MSGTNLLPSGYLSTEGNQIVDASGGDVRIASVGWNQNFTDIPGTVAAMASAGFNTIRLDWVDATLFQSNPTDSINLATIKEIVAAAGAVGMKVIIDHHTDEAGTAGDGYGAQQQNGLWFDKGPGTNNTNGVGVPGTVTNASFEADWVTVARAFAGNPTVIGLDIDNEPLMYGSSGATGVTWGKYTATGVNNGVVGGPIDIHAMYQTVGDAIQAIDPGALIIAEGPQNYGSDFAGTGTAPEGDLSVAAADPVVLNVSNKILYSVHEYPTEISNITPDSGAAAIARMNQAWGYLEQSHVAPVWIGEMGSDMTSANSKAWAATLTAYMNGMDGLQGGPTFLPGEQPVSGDWWVWGYLPGEAPDGTLNQNGTLNQAQYSVWSQLLPLPQGSVACFVHGTSIATPRGEVAVQSLLVGDEVVMASGAVRTITWIGRKTYSKFRTSIDETCHPIRIAAGAFRNGVPSRDLFVSAKHAILFDDVLVPAEHLVNGVSVTRSKWTGKLRYYHLEFAEHDILIANGTPAETFADHDSRGMFDNAPLRIRDREPRGTTSFLSCRDRVTSGVTLLNIVRLIMSVCGQAPPKGVIRGLVDEVSCTLVRGWATDLTCTDVPVFLNVVVDGNRVDVTQAIGFRPDVAAAGAGPTNCGFEFIFDPPLDETKPHDIRVYRHAAEGELTNPTPIIEPRITNVDGIEGVDPGLARWFISNGQLPNTPQSAAYLFASFP